MKQMKEHPLYQEDLDYILSIKDIGKLHGKSFLITGATGMVGVLLIDALMKMKDVKVCAVGRSREKAADRLGEYFDNPRFRFIAQDVCMPFPEDLQADYIIPAASNTHPLAYSRFPIETLMTNLKGAEHALDLAVKCGAAVIYPSSNEIYGNAVGDEDFPEDYNGRLDLSTARACYTESKRACEAMCQSYISEKGLQVKIVRLCRIFGPTLLASDSKAASQFLKKAVAGQDIVLKSEGNQYFSYTYAADAVAGLLTVLLHGENGKAYNVSSEKTNIRLKDFAALCAAYAGKQVVFDLPSETERKGYSIAQKAILSNRRIKNIGFLPHYEIKDAVFRTCEILRQQNATSESAS